MSTRKEYLFQPVQLVQQSMQDYRQNMSRRFVDVRASAQCDDANYSQHKQLCHTDDSDAEKRKKENNESRGYARVKSASQSKKKTQGNKEKNANPAKEKRERFLAEGASVYGTIWNHFNRFRSHLSTKPKNEM